MTPKPEQNEAILNSFVAAMNNVHQAVMHLVAIEPHIGQLEEITRLEDIFAKLRGKYTQRVEESKS